MDISTALVGFIVFANISLASVVFFHNPRARLNRVFAFFVFWVVLWILSNYLENVVGDPYLAEIFLRIDYAFGALVGFFFLLFCFSFPTSQISFSNIKTILLFLPTLIIAILSIISDLVIKDILVVQEGIRFSSGPFYLFYSAGLLGYISFGCLNLVDKYRKSSGVQKTQIFYVLIGLALTCFFVLTINLPQAFVNIPVGLSRLGLYSILFFIAFTTYAIIKHRLMDIRVALRAVLFRLLLIGVLISVYYTLTRLTSFFFPTVSSFIKYASFSVLLVLIYEPLSRYIKAATDRFLFQREYSREEVLKNLGREIATSIDLERILKKVETTLSESLRVEHLSIVLFPESSEANEFNQGNPEGKPIVFGFKPPEVEFKQKDTLFTHLLEKPEILVLDEIKKDLAEQAKDGFKKALEEIALEMEKLKGAVLVPLPRKAGLLGYILLGEKKSGDAFSIQDIDTLETLRFQSAASIENAQFFLQVQTFNEKLRREIKKATFELAQRNKNLTVLRRLDAIVLNTLELDKICQKIVDTVSWELGYGGGLIGLIDKEKKVLRAQAISDTPIFTKVLSLLPGKLESFSLSLEDDKQNLCIKAIDQGEFLTTTDFAELFSPAINATLARKIQKLGSFVGGAVYPLSSKGEKLGAIVFGLPKSFNQISQAEKDLLDAFVNEVGIAIENATLYHSLKELNKELEEANEHLKELDKMKDEFVSVASHELRTPMSVIKNYAWMLLKRREENLNPKQKSYLEKISISANRLIEMVNDMLDVSKIEGGRMELAPRVLRIENLIKEVVLELKEKAEGKGLNLNFEKPKKSLPKVLADKDKIKEVLVNLVGNAIKFTEEGKITLSARKKGKTVQVSVADTGKGIAKEDSPKLFKKFGRLERSFATMAESQGGTGLGLYISKRLIDLHGGKIWAKSQVGKGSTFTFSLRVAGDK